MAIDISAHYQSEAVARSYDTARFTSLAGRTFHRLESGAIHRALACVEKDGRPGAVLDAPCGTGRITELLVSRGYSVVGADISQEMMAVAAARLRHADPPVRFVTADLKQIDMPDRSFDLVTCIRLFHHLDSAVRTQILRELARVTRTFVLTNYSVSSPFYRARRRLKKALGQGISRQSATWEEIRRESAAASLTIRGVWYACRYASEDAVILMTRADA